ncbi:MAG: YlxR family protein [Clostridia bacterium]|nr:YlxR family protein [Clostridia bacterium]
MKQKKIPMRQCCGCLEMKEKAQLVRVVKSPEGDISLDTTGRKNGRGAYICKNLDCFNMAIKKKSFFRAFGQNISEETAKSIEGELKGE